MNTKLILVGALGVQVVLGTGLYLQGARDAADATPVPLLAFAPADADRIVVDDGTKSTTLVLNDAAWQVESLRTLPANTARINSLLDRIGEVTTRWPVVSSRSGRERFEVTEEHYQRKLSLFDGDTLLGSYYFGTSPGFRQTHVRREGEDAVYAITFDNFDLPGDGNDWLDKSLLAVAGVDHIEGPDYVLTRSEDTWSLAAAGAGDAPMLKDDVVSGLASAWRNLRVMRVADAVPDTAQRTEVALGAGQDKWRYTIAKAGEACYVRREGLDVDFTIALGTCDQIAGTRRADLVTLDDTTTVETPSVSAAGGTVDGKPKS